MQRLFPLSLLFLISIGCEKSDTTNPTVNLITLTVDNSFATSTSDDWVIVHDGKTGESLEAQQFESNDSFTIQTNKALKGTSISVTFLKYIGDVGYPNYQLTTYTGFEVGKEIHLNTYSSHTQNNSETEIGTFEIKVTNTNEHCQISNQSGELFGGGGLGINGVFSWDNICYMKDNSNKFLLSATNVNGDVGFKFLENVKPDDVYSYDFNELDEFDHVTTFKFPSSSNVYLYVQGREPGQSILENSYIFNLHYQSDIHTAIKSGYLNRFENYTTLLTAGNSTGNVVYKNNGTIPESEITWPSSSEFTISAKSINNFESSPNVPVKYISALYHYDDPTNSKNRVFWSVKSLNGKHVLQSLPDAIVAKYPILDIDNMVYSITNFYLEAPAFDIEEPDPETTNYVIKYIGIY